MLRRHIPWMDRIERAAGPRRPSQRTLERIAFESTASELEAEHMLAFMDGAAIAQFDLYRPIHPDRQGIRGVVSIVWPGGPDLVSTATRGPEGWRIRHLLAPGEEGIAVYEQRSEGATRGTMQNRDKPALEAWRRAVMAGETESGLEEWQQASGS